jgi:DnaK suppressor protein
MPALKSSSAAAAKSKPAQRKSAVSRPAATSPSLRVVRASSGAKAVLTAPGASAPADDRDYMTAEHLSYFKQRLHALAEAARDALAKASESISAPSITTGDDADRVSEVAAREEALRDVARNRATLSRVSAALQRIGDGSYGYCDETGEPIGLARLRVEPTATLSIDAQERLEHRRKLAAA